MLIIWDSPETPPENVDDDVLYTWNGYVESDSVHSLFKIIEEDDDFYKGLYLKWIYKLGQFRIDDKRVIDHLTFQDGFSFWWMTLFVEKSPWKQQTITDAIRLLALEKVIENRKPSTMKLVSDSIALYEAIKILCNTLGVTFKWEKTSTIISRANIKKSYQKLPIVVRSILSLLLYIKERWKFRNKKKQQWFSENSIFFCSYFFNLDRLKLNQGIFGSAYWGKMIELLKKIDTRSNWLQIYYPHGDVPNAETAKKKINDFNIKKNEQGFHFMLDENIDFTTIRNVFSGYLFLLKKYKKLKNIRPAFKPEGSEVDFWPIMKKDWKETLIGPVVVYNLFYIDLFDKLLFNVPSQRKGIFLYENQSWEKAFIHSWRKHKHGDLIAVPHSTVRYWDLRYFADIETIHERTINSMPQADYVALNGETAKKSYVGFGFPIEKTIECEAIRYTALNSLIAKGKKKKNFNIPTRILLLGDYMPAGTNNLLSIVADAFEHSSVNYHFFIKPHPNYIIKPDKFRIKDLKLVTESLDQIIHDFDIVISGNTTSAAVDAYISGLPVFILIDDTELNFSPLRGQNGVYFVHTANQLFSSLTNKIDNEVEEYGPSEFFYLDENLPRWKNILLN